MEKYGFNGFTVPFNLSSLPLVCGWSTFPSMCFIPLLSRYSWNLLWSPGIPFFPLEKNCVPWSVSISSGFPYNSIAPGEFDVGSGKGTSVNELIKLIENSTGKKIILIDQSGC